MKRAFASLPSVRFSSPADECSDSNSIGERILVIGNAGAGKTTFSLQLADKTSLPLVHLDRLFWYGDWQQRSRAEFDLLLQEELEKPQWIIDGNFSRTFPHRLSYCDTVFFFDVPTYVCLWGITKRLFQYWGKSRPDMGGNCLEYPDSKKWSLYKGVLNYNRRHRENYQRLLSEFNGKVVVFKSRKQAARFLETL